MTQKNFGTMNPATESGTQLAAHLNDWRDTIHSSHRGAIAPTYAVAGMFWVDDSANPEWSLKFYDGSQWIELARFNATTHGLTTGGVFYDRTQTLTIGQQAQARGNIGLADTRLFTKDDPYAVAFTKTGNGTISIKAGTQVEVGGTIYVFDAGTAVTMPALTAGSDYAIWIKPDGTLVATASFSSPPVASSRRLGGFHYAPGGNAAAYNSGGDTTPQINALSIWDEKFRPACGNRGMFWTALGWVGIYMLGTNHHVDGPSAYGVTMADGASPPKIPAMFGGDGSAIYSTFTQYEATEVLASHGQQLMSPEEFAIAAFGVSEATAIGADPVTTGLDSARTSMGGGMQMTGNVWTWSREMSYRYDGAAFTYKDVTGGRGSVYSQGSYGIVAGLLGGYWDSGAGAGSRASVWSNLPWYSHGGVGARGRSDHLCLV